ncbi:DEHA2D06182p [Debaryomyces hansenii CBS767]|uniref:C-22 sterol desaturase ERG5 n=1 Tax=Debaryomyces hansenii (strain ATCC 36239 / CBS 767 / BCRC 21394 / JCM 1990 / NBRC 0083 / IGC 2968) TaxID=284592 RepID=Q6BSU3_DEBHA|nr:DEHA2D06182p [Debaryomyces hansenii CBS767]CAG86871.1 DEHA2D06182p [Debaryomyces hansenii CBS767]|eukprot:XP_458727.1 DEHA2D06182p [Debaryomyces hansenii CBS767]
MSTNSTSEIVDNLSGSFGDTSFFIKTANDLYMNMSWLQLIITTIVLGLSYDQIMYQIRKGSIVGPRLKVWPIIGPFLESLDPKFEEYKAKWDSGPLSCVSIFHKFVVIASSRDLARKILGSPKYVKPCVVDVAIKILRPTNWVFLDGKAHSDYRKSLNGLFSQKALELYIPVQEKYMDLYLEKFVTLDGPTEFFPQFRELLCALSLRTFCGDYITEEQISLITDNYFRITAALELVNFPIIIPYTKTWYGKKIADETMKIFESCAGMSKKHINEDNGKPGCVMDEWIYLMKDAREKHSDDPESKLLIREFSNREISEVIFTFLFASQDASSSLACWLFQVVADRPDIVAKIREEQLRVRDQDPSKPLNLELINEMTYTNNVVKESLRYRPPVLMVPYVVKQSFPVTDTYTAPKGSMIIPTLYPALHDPEVYEDPDSFIPERWENATGDMNKRNWLVFGTGPHICLGKTYVLMLFTSMLGKFVMNSDIIHYPTPLSEEIKVFATIFPKDDLILEWKRRNPLQV